MSAAGALVAALHRPFMVYGIRDPHSGDFRKFTRLSSSVAIVGRDSLSIQDHVWVGHYSVLDASEGLELAEGVQICFHVGIFTHGSEHAIRLLGREYVNVPHNARLAYTRGRVTIGEYSYIGSGSIVLPGVTIGRGCIVAAGSIVTGDVPDYSLAAGSPARIVGNTKDIDRELLKVHACHDTYFDRAASFRMEGAGP